jgi:hypothetical protein
LETIGTPDLGRDLPDPGGDRVRTLGDDARRGELPWS